MIKEVRIAPKNSLILVMDRSVGKVPAAMKGSLVASTDSCIAIGTLSEADGETLISISDQMPAKMPEALLVFDGALNTPSRRLSVCSVLNEALMELSVPESKARVQVWANDKTEPNEIRIVAPRDRVKLARRLCGWNALRHSEGVPKHQGSGLLRLAQRKFNLACIGNDSAVGSRRSGR